jgi:hypothetical protein
VEHIYISPTQKITKTYPKAENGQQQVSFLISKVFN